MMTAKKVFGMIGATLTIVSINPNKSDMPSLPVVAIIRMKGVASEAKLILLVLWTRLKLGLEFSL